MKIKFSRVWAMPNSDTFKIKPIREFVHRYISDAKVSIDSFARNNQWCNYTNDLNPNTQSQYHLEASEFHKILGDQNVKADLWIFDPPYSPRQLKECYDNIGRKMQKDDGMTGRLRKDWKESVLHLLTDDAVVLSFGWNTVGMGKKLGFEIIEIMLVCHGSDHNDTICMAERKINGKLQPIFG